MAVFAALNYSVNLNGTDLSNHVIKVDTKWEVAELDSTTMGNTFKQRIGGLADYSGTIEFTMDFAASSVYSVVAACIGTSVALIVQPVAGSRSATNPGFSATVFCKDFSPLSGQVGELAKTTLTWSIGSGGLTVLTS